MKQTLQRIILLALMAIVALLLSSLSDVAKDLYGDFILRYKFWILPGIAILLLLSAWLEFQKQQQEKSEKQKPAEKPGKKTENYSPPAAPRVILPSPPKHLLETPLGWETFRSIAAQASAGALGRISSKYSQSLYLPRQHLLAAFADFLQSDRVGFVLVGKSGAGKSSFLYNFYQQAPNNLCVLVYDGSVLDPFKRLEDTISEDFQHRLPGAPYIDIWHELARASGPASRQLVVCVDAINENQIDSQELLRRVDEFVRRAAGQAVKVVITSRPETWRIIRADVPLSDGLYYQTAEAARIFKGPFEYSAELNYFTAAELEEVYGKFEKELDLPVSFKQLSPELCESLRDPLVLWMVAPRLMSGVAPDRIRPHTLVKDFMDHLVKSRQLMPEDIIFLQQVLMPLMIHKRYQNRISMQDLRAVEEKTTFNQVSLVDIAQARQHKLNDRTQHPFSRLVDAKILAHKGFGDSFEIFFEYERFWDYFGGVRLYEMLKMSKRAGPEYVRLIEQIKEHPYLWGALLQSLSYLFANRQERVLLHIAGSANSDASDLVSKTLLDYALEDRDSVERFLRRLVSGWQRRIGDSAVSQAVIAIEVAGKLEQWDVLEQAGKSRDEVVRDRAVVQLYKLWLANHDKGYTLLDRLVQQIHVRTLLTTPGLLMTSFSLSLLIFLRHYESEPGLTRRLQTIWASVFERFLFYRPGSGSDRLRSLVRNRLLSFLFRFALRLTGTIPGRYSIMNLGELRQFFRLPDETRAKAAPLIAFIDGSERRPEAMRAALEDLYSQKVNGSPLNNMLLKLMIDYSLVALGLENRQATIDLLLEFGYRELYRPGNVSRITWDKCWVLAALAFLQKDGIDDQLFEEFTRYLEQLYRSNRAWHGALGEYALVGYADYAHVYHRKTGSRQVKPLQEMMAWAVESKHHQKVLDLLEELGYLAASSLWETTLFVMQPVLSYAHIYEEAHDPLAEHVFHKMVEVLARTRARHPAAVEEFFQQFRVPGLLQEKVRARKTEELVAGDLLKGGLGAWGQFEVRQGFSPHGRPILAWIMAQVLEKQSFNDFLLVVAKRAINILYGEDIFPEVNPAAQPAVVGLNQ